ncbi:MAG: sirohydrochlorin cobaltochelatase [Fastidiosipilaceae bacterium]|jgi:sirohydrochlorin cobaltochelatase
MRDKRSRQTTNIVRRSAEVTADPDKKVMLVVSFGTSYLHNQEVTIGAIEESLAHEFEDFDIRRAFTSQMIINKLKRVNNMLVDNVEQAMDHVLEEGYGTVVVQPTHIMNGLEYDDMLDALRPYREHFPAFAVGAPLLTETDDFAELVKSLIAEIPEIKEPGGAVVFMGHGSSHFANSVYAALDYKMSDMGYQNAVVGTVEEYPDLAAVKRRLADCEARKVYLYPLMIVAGDHVHNDMAGEHEDSWQTLLEEAGYEVVSVLRGMGEYQGIRQMFVDHARLAVDTLDS